MNRRRKSDRGLTESRIYRKNNRFYLFAPVELVNPTSGKAAKWHSLCHIDEGQDKARAMAKAIWDHNRQQDDQGDMTRRLREWNAYELRRRDAGAPTDPARKLMHEKRNADLRVLTNLCSEAFCKFDVPEVAPSDVAEFVDQWEGRRMAEVMRSHLSKFFQWACRKGYRRDNPTREVSLEKVESRTVYITHEQFHKIRDAMLVGADGKATQTGEMVQCYMDLCYLLYQRTTEIRLLKWSDITEAGIRFKPTKTEKSSGKDVFVPMTDAVRRVLDRCKKVAKISSIYVIATKQGQPYDASGLRTAFRRAGLRVGISGLTLKDLRAKALTDANQAGFDRKQLAVGAAHADEKMTEHYIRIKDTPVSEVMISLPPR